MAVSHSLSASGFGCADGKLSGEAGAAVASAVLFFILTNFGVWALRTLYPNSLAGLTECYVVAIPFFRNTLLSDLFYSALLFGGLALAEKGWPVLAEGTPTAA